MRLLEFRQWADDALGFRWSGMGNNAVGFAVWGGLRTAAGRNGYGYGHAAQYGPVQQRRLIVWHRIRRLVAQKTLDLWLEAAEGHNDGWLVNDGSGIRWVVDPEKEAHQLAARGFVAVRCGL